MHRQNGNGVLAEVAPAAHLDRGTQVLLLNEVIEKIASPLATGAKATSTPPAAATDDRSAKPATAEPAR